MSIFHLAVPVRNVDESVAFYTERFGCTLGRRNERSAVLNFFNHQVVLHLDERPKDPLAVNPVDSVGVPVPHFGLLLERDEWEALRERLQALNTEFVVGPYIRYQGTSGEQATMFFYDPSGNALEFKSFADPAYAFTPWTAEETHAYQQRKQGAA